MQAGLEAVPPQVLQLTNLTALNVGKNQIKVGWLVGGLVSWLSSAWSIGCCQQGTHAPSRKQPPFLLIIIPFPPPRTPPRQQDLPLGFGTLTRLRDLTLKGNPLRPPYPKLIECHGDLAVITSLLDCNAVRVDLSECGFEKLPSEVVGVQRGALRELVLTNNKLNDLPQVRGCLVECASGVYYQITTIC